jgi:hypothetical protein
MPPPPSMTPEEFVAKLKIVLQDRRDRANPPFSEDMLRRIDTLGSGPKQDLQKLLDDTKPPGVSSDPSVCCRYVVGGQSFCARDVDDTTCKGLGGQQVRSSSCAGLGPYNG